MIIGIGTDLTSIPRIHEVLERHGDRFINRCFSAFEKEKVEKSALDDISLRAAGYAKRWAAKEACAKALSIGIRDSVFLKDISVKNDAMGKPSLELTGGAARQLHSLMPEGMKPSISISLTDEPPMALAFVVISAIPAT